ncbi:helix-turn-helix protein [compost metagenome]
MPLIRPLAAVLRLVRVARGLSQERFSGSVEARHIHNLENAKASATIATLETLADRLDIDPVALLGYASQVEKGFTTSQYQAYLQSEMHKISELGIDQKIALHYRDGDVVTHSPGRRTDPAKVKAVLDAKAAGKSKKEVSEALGMARSTVNDIWNRE